MTHIWDGGNIALELNNSGAVINRFIRGLTLINSTQHGWYIFNVRGDVVQRVDTNTANNTNPPGTQAAIIILHTYQYDAFGNELNYDPANSNPFRFAGEYWDHETQTYYLRARHFNPRIGRFTQADPFWGIHNMQGSTAAIMQAGNLYMYTMHNPVRWVDPSGLSAALPPAPMFFPSAGVGAQSFRTMDVADGSGQSLECVVMQAIAIPYLVPKIFKVVAELLSYWFAWEIADTIGEIMSFGVSRGGTLTDSERIRLRAIDSANDGVSKVVSDLMAYLAGGTGDPNDPRNWGNNNGEVDPHKLNHIFGQSRHNLDGLLRYFGGNQVSAYNTINRIAQAHVTRHGLTGVNQFTINVVGHDVTVRGAVINGIFRIGTAFIP